MAARLGRSRRQAAPRRVLILRIVGLTCFTASQFCQGASVSGTIVDDYSGMPVPFATLTVLGDRMPYTVQANEDGTFRGADLSPGDYSVIAAHPGYLYTSMATRLRDNAASGDTVKLPALRMIRLGAIAGHVSDLHGRSARVMALLWSPASTSAEGSWKPVLDSAAVYGGQPTTRGTPVDSNGDFRIPDLPPGLYALLIQYSDPQTHVEGPGSRRMAPASNGLLRYPEGKKGISLGPGGSTVVVGIAVPTAVGRTIEGHIALSNSESWCWVTLSDPAQPALSVAPIETGDGGAFAFRGVVPGVYVLLVAPGGGKRDARPPVRVTAYSGFARADVDVRRADAKGIEITPGQQIGGSVVLRESAPLLRPSTRCWTGEVTLTTIEDWGVDLQRRQSLVQITLQEAQPAPEFVSGLAPARYVVSVGTIAGCRLRNEPVLDMSDGSPANAEVQVMEPGTISGHAILPTEVFDGWEVLLIPDDFAEGLPLLPANWFSESNPTLLFVWGSYWGVYGPGLLPFIRSAAISTGGSFRFPRVPAGHYRIALRSADPTTPGRSLEWRDLKQVDLQPSGSTFVDLEAAEQEVRHIAGR